MREIEYHPVPAVPMPPAGWPSPEESEHASSQLRDYLQILLRRWRLIAGFALGASVLMGIACILAERWYTATAVLHVESQAPQVTNIPQVAASPSYFEGVEYFQDQVKILESRTLAAQVIRQLNLEADDRFTERGRQPTLIDRALMLAWWPVDTVLWAIDALSAPPASEEGSAGPPTPALGVKPGFLGKYRRLLEVKPITNTRLIQVSFTTTSPRLSQQLADAHTSQYIRQTLQSRFELTGEARRFLEAEIERVRAELAKSEAALNEFRWKHAVVSLDANENAVVQRLGDLGRRLTEIQAERITSEAEYRLVQSRQYDSLPAVMGNSLVQSLKNEVNRLELRQAELGEIFLSGSPQMKEVISQLRQARTRLDKEMARAVGGIESVYIAARAKEESLRAEFEEAQKTALNLKEVSGQYIQLDQAVTAHRTLHATLLTRVQETDVVRGVQLSNASILDPAEVPLKPSYPNVLFNLAYASILGLGLGTMLAFVLENVDTSLKTPDDVRRMLHLPTLGVVPDFAAMSARGPRALLAARVMHGRAGGATVPARASADAVHQRSLSAEAYRSIRTSLLFFNPDQPPRSLLITSSQSKEGKTATTVNLGISLARLGSRVIVVDADLRQPRCHRALGLPLGPGLSEVLRGQKELADVTLAVSADAGHHVVESAAEHDGPMLHLLQSGKPPMDPAELLASARMREVLRTLNEHYDTVLIDSPPVFPITDSAILAPVVDGVVLVVRGQQTDRQVIREALERLRLMKANVIGVVLNAVDPGSHYYNSYSYYFAA